MLRALFILLILSFNLNAYAEVWNRDVQNYNVKLQVHSANSKIAEFMVAIADDDEKRAYGLMNLEHLPKKNGMLFVFREKQIISMWMKNTEIPLDMIFIDQKGIIASIETNTKPESLDIISSSIPVTRVLEINAGLVEKLGIKVGQRVVSKL